MDMPMELLAVVHNQYWVGKKRQVDALCSVYMEAAGQVLACPIILYVC